MSDAVVHRTSLTSSTALCLARLAARAGRSLSRMILARATRHALTGLPDDLLGDMGLARSDIPFVVDAIARGEMEPLRDVPHRFARTVTR